MSAATQDATQDAPQKAPQEAPLRGDPNIVFSPAVKAMQTRLGSRAQVERLETHRGFRRAVDDDLAGFLESRDSVYIATASADGRPYIQHRGGARGFLRRIDAGRIAFGEQPGNRQYVSFGNLSENDRIALFAMDYPTRQRIKVWGRARMIARDPAEAAAAGVSAAGASGEDDAAVWARLGPEAARAIVISVEAWDVNCPKFITERYTAEEVAAATTGLRETVAAQAAEIAALRATLAAAARGAAAE